MYADRSSGRKRSVIDRLGSAGGSRSRPDDAKRYRRDDGTWRRELYKDSGGTQISSGHASRNLQSNQKSHVQQRIEVVKKSSVLDLREKLSGVPVHVPSSVLDSENLQSKKKSHVQQSIEVVKKSSVPDLRHKLSGAPVQRPQLNSTVEVPKPVKGIVKIDKPVPKKDPSPTSALPVTKKVGAPSPAPASSAPASTKSEEKVDASLHNLLKSLDLEKYLINFQAEEVDMKALVYMNEEDMKVLGIPMGPRKKILSTLAHKKRKSSKSLPTS